MEIRWTVTKTPKEWREKHKLSQKEMAEILGITRAAYNRIETGKATPSIETIMMMWHISSKEHDEEKYGEGKTYSVFRIRGMYEIDIEEE